MWVLRFKRAALKRFTYLTLFLFLLVGLALPFLAMAGDKGGLEKSKKDDLKIKDTNFNESVGGVKEGKSIWHLKEGFLLQNVTPETSQKGEYVYVEYENDSKLIGLNASFRFYNGQAKVDFFEVFRNVSTQQTIFNRSDEEFFNATNASYWNATTYNYSTELSSEMKWVKVAPKILDNGSITYYTTDFIFGENIKAIPTPLVYGGIVKYDVLTCDGDNCNVIDPILNATFSNATAQSDANTSVPDFAPFVDGKWIMGAGNRSNITGYDSWGDQNYNANPDWKAYELSVPGDCLFQVSTANSNLSLTTDDTGACTLQAIRDVNISIPKEAGIIVSFWMQKDLVNVNLEAGMCLVTDSSIVNNSNIRCNGGNDLLFVRDSNNHYIYPKGGATAETWGSGSSALQHVEVWSNWSHAKACFDGVCSGTIAYASTTEVQNAYLTIFFHNNNAAVYTSGFFNVTIANASQFGQPFNLTPARFETVLMNSTAVIDKVKITNISYKYAGANANWFVMDKNHLNQQGVNEGTDTDITDITGSIVNATFAPQNINVTSELYAVQVEWTPVAAAPSVVLPSVNVSIINRTSSNASVILASEHVWSNANYSHASNLPEENSTFKWFTNNTNQSWGGGNRTAEMVAMIYKGTVGYWHLDGDYADSSGFGNTGTNSGNKVINTTGVISGAANFNATSWIAAGTKDFYNFTGNFSYALWFKHGKNFADGRYYISKMFTTAARAGGWTAYYTPASGILTARIADADSVAAVSSETSGFDNDAWHYLTVTINRQGNQDLYVDGVLKDSDDITAIGSLANAWKLTIGAMRDGAIGQFNGSIDEVGIWNRTLTASEVKQLYLRTWYDVSPQLFLLNGESLSRLNASNQSDFNTTDMERPTAISGATLQPGRYVDNLTVDVNTSGYWRFDDLGSGSDGLRDLSGNGNNGTILGPVFVNDSVGGTGLYFDGVDDSVNVSDSANLTLSASMAISVWFKPVLDKNTPSYIVMKGEFQADGYILAYIRSTGVLDFYTSQSGAYQRTQGGAGTGILNNTWSHVVVTVNQGTSKIYVNGNEISGYSTKNTHIAPADGNTRLVIGNSIALAFPVKGTIDELRILNRSMNASEVLADYRKAAKGLGLLSNDYINYSAAGNFNEKEGTIEFWVKPEWNGNDNLAHVLFDTETAADFNITKTTSNDLAVYFGNPGRVLPRYNITNWTSGNWKHVAVTWNNYTSTTTMHIDGLQVNNSGTAFAIPVPKSYLIGSMAPGTSDFANATISEFRISRKALTAQEINESFSKGRAYFQNEYLLNSSNYQRGDALILEYSPKDNSSMNGSKTNSSMLLVQNAPPSNPIISYPVNNAYVQRNHSLNFSSSDANGDPITFYVFTNTLFNKTVTVNTTLNLSDGMYQVNVTAYDGEEFSAANATVNYTVDGTNPLVTNTLFATTGGITTSPLIFGSTMDWIAATVTDSFLNHVNVTVRDGAGTVVVDNKAMTNQGSNIWNYTTDISLSSGAGNWTINISGFDNATNGGAQLTNFTLNTQNVSTKEGLYGYGNNTPLSVADIAALTSYGYDVFETSDNISTMGNISVGNFGTVLAVTNASLSASSLIGINYKLDFNYSIPNEVAKARGNISISFPNLKNVPYVTAISYVSFELVNQTLYNDTDKTVALNDLALNATNAFTTQFPIYSKNFNNSNLTAAYIKFTPLIYVYAGSQAELITNERNMLRQNKSLNRIYVNLTTALKSQAKNYHNDVIKQLRGTPANNANLGNLSVAEIDSSVNDVVVFNIGATEQVMNINVSNISGLIGKDIWDATQKKLLANNTNGVFDVNVSAHSANLLFSEDIDHIQLDGSSTGDVYKASTPLVANLNYTDGTRDDNYALYGANDARIELFDPHYIGNNFLTYYGWINASMVNLSNKIPYTNAIISDTNDQEIDKLNYSETTWYAYISVADYANTNAWVTGKEGEVDDWIARNGSLHIFIDGLDSGIGGTNFSSRFKDVVDYTRITKDRNLILNTYTAYVNFSTWGDGVMKESCVQRWNGADAANPTSYSREVWDLELNRSKFFHNHNIPVFCQAFGNRTTVTNFNQIMNYTDTLNIFYASKVLGYQNFYLSQPDFNYVHTIYVPNLGTDLSNDALTDDNVTYYRRYSNGIVYYNTTSTQGWIDDGRTILSTKLCFDLYDAHANSATFSFTINREVTGAEPGDYNVSDSELGGVGVWTNKCLTLNSTHQNLGRWDIQAFALPRTITVGQGLNIGNAIVGYENRHSWYDSSTSPNSWTQYSMGQNWQISIEINDTKKASVDTVNTITQTEANATIDGKLLQNITLSSGFNVNTEVWSNPTFVNSTAFLNLSYLSGSAFVPLNYTNNTDCTGSNPTFNTTTISGNPFKSCITSSTTGYYIRVAPYKLSDQIFQANFQANTAPTIQLIFPSNGTNTSFNSINFSATDAEGDALTCSLFVNGTFNQSNNCLSNMTLAATPERNYVINVTAADASLFSANISASYTFDNRTPLLNNATNSNATIANPIYLPTSSAFLNFTYTEPLNATFTIQNTSGGVSNNITTAITANSGAFWFTFTGLNEGNYSFKGYINDTSANVNRTGNISITIDTVPPVPLFMPPTPANNSLTANNRINISTNITETNFMNTTISIFNQTGLLNRTGFTSPNASINYTLNDGVYQISITAYDLANNSNTSLSTNFTIDTTAPNISVERPFQNEKTGATFNIQFQVNDTTGISQCNITSGVLGTISNGTALNVSNGQENNHMNASGLLPGNQVSFSVRCIDLAGNTAVSPVRTFSIAERAGFVGGDGGVQGDVMQKKQCAAGEKPFSLNGTDYCTPCKGVIAAINGTAVIIDGEARCVEKSEPVQASMNPLQSLPGSKGATILMVMALVAYVVFGTSLIFKKKPKVKFNG